MIINKLLKLPEVATEKFYAPSFSAQSPFLFRKMVFDEGKAPYLNIENEKWSIKLFSGIETTGREHHAI